MSNTYYYTYGHRMCVCGEKFLRCQTPRVSEEAVKRFIKIFGAEKVENLGLCGSLSLRVDEYGNSAILVCADSAEMAKKAIEARYVGRHTVDFPVKD